MVKYLTQAGIHFQASNQNIKIKYNLLAELSIKVDKPGALGKSMPICFTQRLQLTKH